VLPIQWTGCSPHIVDVLWITTHSHSGFWVDTPPPHYRPVRALVHFPFIVSPPVVLGSTDLITHTFHHIYTRSPVPTDCGHVLIHFTHGYSPHTWVLPTTLPLVVDHSFLFPHIVTTGSVPTVLVGTCTLSTHLYHHTWEFTLLFLLHFPHADVVRWTHSYVIRSPLWFPTGLHFGG